MPHVGESIMNWIPSPSKMSTTNNDRVPVDLRLAKTYMPALSCLARGTVLILIVSRPWASLNVPLLMVFCTILYIDRAVRVEAIFDSNALLCTLLASYAANIFRSDPENHQLLISSVTTTAATTVSGPSDIWSIGLQACFVVFSLTLLAGIDPFTMSTEIQQQSAFSACKGYVVILNGILLMCVIQTPLDRSSVVSPVQILIRGYGFLLLSLAWTYAIGVPEMICLLSSTSRVQSLTFTSQGKGKKKHPSSATVVQSFLSCHIRFTHILLSSGYCLYIGTVVFAGVLLYRIYMASSSAPFIMNNNHIPESAASIHPEYFIDEGSNTGVCSVFDSENGILQSATPPMYVSYQSPLCCPGAGDMSIASGRIFHGDTELGCGVYERDDPEAAISAPETLATTTTTMDTSNWKQQPPPQPPRVPLITVPTTQQVNMTGIWSTASSLQRHADNSVIQHENTTLAAPPAPVMVFTSSSSSSLIEPRPSQPNEQVQMDTNDVAAMFRMARMAQQQQQQQQPTVLSSVQ